MLGCLVTQWSRTDHPTAIYLLSLAMEICFMSLFILPVSFHCDV